MPARMRLRILRHKNHPLIYDPPRWSHHHQYATAAVATATTPAPSISQMTSSNTPASRYSSVQPPSHRPPEFRKSQLLRSYVSLLQSTPLILLFQHNNLRATEWTAIRRELASAMQKLDGSLTAQGHGVSAVGSQVKLQIIQTNIFEPAVRIAEFYRPSPPPPPAPSPPRQGRRKPTTTTTTTTTTISSDDQEGDPAALTHVLSESAYKAVLREKGRHPLTPLLIGSLALLTFPTVSPQYLKAALQIVAPQAPAFPAPPRKVNPGYWDPAVQSGLKKLMLLGARVEGKVFDAEGTRWVGGIDGGIDGLRAQLVYMLQGVGAGITVALEGAGASLYFTMESRRQMLDEEQTEAERGGGVQ